MVLAFEGEDALKLGGGGVEEDCFFLLLLGLLEVAICVICLREIEGNVCGKMIEVDSVYIGV